MKPHCKLCLFLVGLFFFTLYAVWVGRTPEAPPQIAQTSDYGEEPPYHQSYEIYGSSHDHRRSSKWSTVRDAYLKKHNRCAYKGCTRGPLEVHHIKPFHTNPELELDESNFITLCRDPIVDHHLYGGHDGNFKNANPNIREDAAQGRYPKHGGKLQKLHEKWVLEHSK